MARMSAQAKAAATWRASASPPAKPKWLAGPAASLWEAIVSDRPADHFRAGSHPLLAMYCHLVAQLERELQGRELAIDEQLKAQTALLQLGRMADKLRLTPAANVGLKSGARAERGSPTAKLLGGHAIPKH